MEPDNSSRYIRLQRRNIPKRRIKGLSETESVREKEEERERA